MMNANMGTVISGTMRPQDLIPAFCDMLESLLAQEAKDDAQGYATVLNENLISRARAGAEVEGYYESETAMWDLESLFEALDEFAPEGTYFGAHPGDGADYGYWQIEEE